MNIDNWHPQVNPDENKKPAGGLSEMRKEKISWNIGESFIISTIFFVGILAIYFWRLPGFIIWLVNVMILIFVVIHFASKNILWTSGVQNAGVAIMKGTGSSAILNRFIVIQDSDSFWLDASGNHHEASWFEKKYNIWWMGLLGSVYEYLKPEIKSERSEQETEGKENINEQRQTVWVTKRHINIEQEERIPMIIPPIPCQEQFDVIIDAIVFYIIRTPADALKALFKVADLPRTLNDKIEVGIKTEVSNKKYAELLMAKDKMNIMKGITSLEEGKQITEHQRIKDEWGVDVLDTRIKDITPEDTAATKLKSVVYAELQKQVTITNAQAESDANSIKGDGEGERLKKNLEGRASGFKMIAAVPGGIELQKLETLEKMTAAKIFLPGIGTNLISNPIADGIITADLVKDGEQPLQKTDKKAE